MIRSVGKKVMWVGRATVFFVGLAVILALLFGAASMALAKNGDPWILGKANVATAITSLGGKLGVNGAMVRITNNNAGANDTALDLRVQAGEPPLRVNRATKVTNLNADKLDGKSSTQFLTASRYKVFGNYTLGEPDPRTNGRHATLSCDKGDMLVNGSYYTGTVNNPNHYMGSNIITDDTWELEWWVPGGGSGGYVGLVVTCLDTAAPAH